MFARAGSAVHVTWTNRTSSAANRRQQRASTLFRLHLALQAPSLLPLSSSTTSFTTTQTMSAAVHPLPPQVVAQYPRQPINGTVNSNPAGPSVKPTPPMGTRKRKRAARYSVQYSEVQEFDSDGRLREVIVIEDTPPPATISPATTHPNYSSSYQPPIFSAPIRTRARAAAEAQALSSTSSSITAPVPKRQKRDPQEEVRAPPPRKPVHHPHQIQALVPPKSNDFRNGVVPDDVRIRLYFVSMTY